MMRRSGNSAASSVKPEVVEPEVVEPEVVEPEVVKPKKDKKEKKQKKEKKEKKDKKEKKELPLMTWTKPDTSQSTIATRTPKCKELDSPSDVQLIGDDSGDESPYFRLQRMLQRARRRWKEPEGPLETSVTSVTSVETDEVVLCRGTIAIASCVWLISHFTDFPIVMFFGGCLCGGVFMRNITHRNMNQTLQVFLVMATIMIIVHVHMRPLPLQPLDFSAAATLNASKVHYAATNTMHASFSSLTRTVATRLSKMKKTTALSLTSHEVVENTVAAILTPDFLLGYTESTQLAVGSAKSMERYVANFDTLVGDVSSNVALYLAATREDSENSFVSGAVESSLRKRLQEEWMSAANLKQVCSKGWVCDERLTNMSNAVVRGLKTGCELSDPPLDTFAEPLCSQLERDRAHLQMISTGGKVTIITVVVIGGAYVLGPVVVPVVSGLMKTHLPGVATAVLHALNALRTI